MTRKRKDGVRPQRLTDFFQAPSGPTPQRGDRGSKSGSPASSGSGHFSEVASDGGDQSSVPPGEPQHRSSPPQIQSRRSPLPRSPAKSRPRLSGLPQEQTEVSSPHPSIDDTQLLLSPIEDFPANDQPLSATTLKEMLLSLRGTIQTDMQHMIAQFKTDVSAVGDRVSHVENKMGEFATTFNELVDAHNEREDDITWLKAKVADLEDRSRRNNIKIRGIPESVNLEQLLGYVQDFFMAVLPNLTSSEITVDRIHRLPKPSHLPAHLPRDTLLRVHFFHAKERLMTAVRKADNVPREYAHLQLYADLSQHTLALRRSFLPVTKALRNHKITYRWGYPTKLVVSKDDKLHQISSVGQGLKLLSQWQILPSSSSEMPSPHRTNPDWKVVTKNRGTKT